ncbi:MAG TPA: putative metal-binding motif-containing protein [Kofleriaceae bacterium]|nr:putative metal-binding motif-containing protein [Kofleriaceae bacterium]
MTGRALIGLALLAACGSDRIVIELDGAVPGAKRVDVTLLEPVVLAKLQRSNDRNGPMPTNTPERVFYVAQRATVGFPLDGEAVDGLQFEIKDGGGPYVPLVAVRDDQGVLALGIYNPGSVSSAELGSEYVPDTVDPVGDVTVYPIQLEPAKGFEASADQPSGVARGEVMVVRCGPNGPVSGAVWRRADGKQLRLLLPLEDEASAVDRLDAPDLDCDDHSPGPVGLAARGEGDRLDCDDTAFVVHAGAAERCSTFDEDCNPETTVSQVACQCALTGGVCACVDPGLQSCPEAAQSCTVPSQSSAMGRTPCDSRGQLALLAQCTTTPCVVTLASVPPGWDVRIGGDHGLADPVDLPAGQRLPIAVRPTSVPSTGSGSAVALLSVKPVGSPVIYAVKLQLMGDVCVPTNLISCQ